MPKEALLTNDERSSLLTALPTFIRCVQQPRASLESVRQFMDMLSGVDASLFCGALLYLSRDGGPFVMIRRTESCEGSRNGWSLWPLERLFPLGRACVITNPASNARALAVPFNSRSSDRYVVVAMLRAVDLNAAQALFLQTMESCTAGPAQTENGWHASVLDRVSVERGSERPSLVWYGSGGPLYAHLSGVGEQRGWPMQTVKTFGELLALVAQNAADIVVLHGTVLHDRIAKLRALRHAGRECPPLLLFIDSDKRTGELMALVDERIAVSATTDQLFVALKRLIAALPERRTRTLTTRVLREESRLQASPDYVHLSRAVADSALSIGADHVAVTLIDRSGKVFTAEAPFCAEPLVGEVPSSFLSGYAVMRSRIDSQFLEEIFDDEATRKRLLAIKPLSGASIPIVEFGRVVGTIFVLFTAHHMTEAHAKALGTLSEVASLAFSTVANRVLQMTELDERAQWKHTHLRAASVHAYKGVAATACPAVMQLDDDRALCVVADSLDAASSQELADGALRDFFVRLQKLPVDEAIFSVIAAFERRVQAILVAMFDGTGNLYYGSMRCGPPLQIPVSGPVSTLTESRNRHHGKIALHPDAVTLLYCPGFSRRVDTAEMIKAVRYQLQHFAPNPAVSVPQLCGSDGKLSFVGVKMHSADFEPQRPLALS